VDVDISTSGTEYTCIFQHSGSYKLYEETYDTSFYVEVTPDAGYYSDEKGTKKLDQSETYDNEGQQFLYSDNNTTFYFINKEPDTYSVKTDSEGNVQRYVYDKILGDIEDDSNSVTITPVTVDENSSSDMVVYKITLDDDFALGTGFYIIITDEVEDINYYKFIRTRLADGSLVCSQEDDESYVRKLDNVETKSSYTAFFGTYSYDVNADTEPDAESANAVTETPSIQKYADDGWVDVEEADKATISPAEDAGYYTYKFMNPGKYRFVYNDTYVTVTVSKSIDRLVYTDEFDYYNNNYNLDDARYYDEFQYTVSTKDSGAIFFGTGIPNSKEVTPVSTKPVIQKQNGESWSEATEDDATLTEVDEHPNFYIYNFKTAGQYRYAYTNGDEDPSYIYVTVISCLGEFSASGDTNDALEHTWDYQTFTYNELKKEFYFICQKVDYLENKL
jgi:hypothetical protein